MVLAGLLFLSCVLFVLSLHAERDLLRFEVVPIIDLEAAAREGRQFLIYNRYADEYLFVSNDMSVQDNLVETHKYQYEARNVFKLEKAGDNYRFYNVEYKRWLFVSEDRRRQSHVVEAHQYRTELRNQFRLLPAPNEAPGHFLILNVQYDVGMFVSDDKNRKDRIVEANRLDRNAEPYVFVLHGIKGVLGSTNRDMYDRNYDTSDRHGWLFWIVVIIFMALCALAIFAKLNQRDRLRKFR